MLVWISIFIIYKYFDLHLLATCSKILIPKPEEPDIIDLTEDDEIDTKSNISAVKESNKSVIMNIFITSQNGEIKKHIISVL